MEQKSKRNSNIELLRVLAMLLIISYHALTTEIIDAQPDVTIYAWNQLLGNWGILGVDLFVIISAWFSTDQSFRIRKVFSIVFQTFTWVLFFVIASAVYHFLETGSISYVVQRLFMGTLEGMVQPLWVRRYWFITAYFYMMLLSPLMNRMIGSFSRKSLGKILLILLFIPIYSNFQHDAVSDAMNFCYLYLLTGYIRRYRPRVLVRFAKPRYILLLALLCVTARLALRLPVPATLQTILHSGLSHTFAANERHSFVMMVLALLVFYWTVSLPPRSNQAVNTVASRCLGVYMFHENHIMDFPNVTQSFFTYLADIGFLRFTPVYPLPFLAGVLVLFLAGTCLEALRFQLLQKPFQTWLNRFDFSPIDRWFEDISFGE